jgi:hypothetical protein
VKILNTKDSTPEDPAKRDYRNVAFQAFTSGNATLSKNFRKCPRCDFTGLFVTGAHALERTLKTLVAELPPDEEGVDVLLDEAHGKGVLKYMDMPQSVILPFTFRRFWVESSEPF